MTRTESSMSFQAASRRRERWLIAYVVAVVAAGCGHDVSSPPSPRVAGPASYGKSSTNTFSVSSVSPDTGSLSTTLDVQISGSGFADGMVASWQLSGVADPTQIKTNSTRYVSSKQLVANITISGTATAASWDVAIYSGGKTGIGSELGVLKQAFKVLDPTATFAIPLSDAGLSIRSDRMFSDGTNSLYTDGSCNVSAKIFATTQLSTNPSGDATLNTGTGSGKCARRITVIFPDGTSESEGTFMNLREIEDPSYSIPIGATVRRQLHVGTDQTPSTHSRCGGFVFGYGVRNDVGAGSDSLWVTRVDARTWHAYSDPQHNLAWCKNTGQLFPMTVDLTVISNRPLP